MREPVASQFVAVEKARQLLQDGHNVFLLRRASACIDSIS